MWTAEQEETHIGKWYIRQKMHALKLLRMQRKQTKDVEITVLVSNNKQHVSLRRTRLKREVTWSLHGENKVSPEVLLFP